MRPKAGALPIEHKAVRKRTSFGGVAMGCREGRAYQVYKRSSERCPSGVCFVLRCELLRVIWECGVSGGGAAGVRTQDTD